MSVDDPTFVRFRVDSDEDADVYVESVPAVHIKGQRYRLTATPFFAYRASLGDSVRCVDDDDAMPVVEEITHKSGNRTLRAILPDESPVGSSLSDALMDELATLRCGCATIPPILIAINVPARVDLLEVIALLTRRGLRWDAGDPVYGDLFG